MLKAHMDAREKALVAISRIPANSGHSLHKGTPREAFVREFLVSHLPANVAVGTGEIIDANSRPGEQRNQFDIVIYRSNFPKLDFGGGITGFLVESVIATIEVKSTLGPKDLEQAIKAARAAKSLTPNVSGGFTSGYIPPRVLNYVLAYDGPASMRTVYGWVPEIHRSLGVAVPRLPGAVDSRVAQASPSIDGVFVLEKGFLYFDNAPVGFANEPLREAHPDLKWVYADSETGNLLLLFALLQSATANIQGRWLNAVPYLASHRVTGLQLGEE